MLQRPWAERPRISASGAPLRPNALLVARLEIDGHELAIFPTAMPALLREHVDRAMTGIDGHGPVSVALPAPPPTPL